MGIAHLFSGMTIEASVSGPVTFLTMGFEQVYSTKREFSTVEWSEPRFNEKVIPMTVMALLQQWALVV